MQQDEAYPLEYNIYALCLRVPGSIKHFAEHLSPELVGIPTGNTGLHELYLAFLDFYKHTGLDPIDSIAFQAWLSDQGRNFIEALGGENIILQYLQLFNDVPLSNAEAVTAVLKHRANKRKQINALQELQLLINSKDIKTEADRQKLSRLTDEIRSLEKEIGSDPLSYVTTADDMIQGAEDLWNIPDFIKSPYPSLNVAMGYTEDGGFIRGGVYIVAAPSSHGKSTLVKCFANYWLDNGYSVLYINFEEAKQHWERILMTQITGQNVYAGINFDQREYYTQIYQKRLRDWGNRLMVRHDPETSYFDDLELWFRDILGHNERIPDVIIIDTIQSMTIKSGGKPRWGEYEQMMIRLEKLAKDMNCALILTAQENLQRLKDKREVAEQFDIGGSITLVQKSTATIVITKKRNLAGNDAEDESIVQLQIPKNRITGTVFIDNPPLLRYNDNTKSFEEYLIPEDTEFIEWPTITNGI